MSGFRCFTIEPTLWLSVFSTPHRGVLHLSDFRCFTIEPTPGFDRKRSSRRKFPLGYAQFFG